MKNNYYSIQDKNRKDLYNKKRYSSNEYSSRSHSKSQHSSKGILGNDFPALKKDSGSNINTSVRKKQATQKKSKNKHHLVNGKRTKINYKKLTFFILILTLLIYALYYAFSKLPGLFKKSTEPNFIETFIVPSDITIDMAVVGDIMCHSSNIKAAYNSETNTYDFTNFFTQVAPYLQEADITVGNLETTFAGANAIYSGYPNFNTPEQLATNLVSLGFDVVSTANNHSLDKRYAGLESTLNELDKVGLAHTGTYRSAEEQNTIVTKNVNGINIAFLSFTYGTNGIPVPSGKEYCINLIDKQLILDQISRANQLNPDVLCVFMHWGEEYKLVPNKTQKELADFLFENGVDIILGSHPHVLESMEKRSIATESENISNSLTGKKDGFLIYSLGNFVSGQVIEDTRNSIILKLKITKHADSTITIDSYDYIPTYLYDKGEGQVDRFKVLDVNKCIEDYKSGKSDISESLYNTLVKTKDKFDKVLAGN